MKRDAKAVCWANYKQYFDTQDLDYCYSLNDSVQSNRLYDDLIVFWKETVGDFVYHVDDEQLVQHPDKVTRRLISRLGLPWEETSLRPQKNNRKISTASNIRARQEINQGS